MSPPGNRVLDWAASLFGNDIADRVFQPLVADWQHEWRDAPAGIARWRPWLSGWHEVVVATLMSGATMAAPWRAEHRLRGQSARIFTAFSIAGTAIVIVPFLRDLEHPARGLFLLPALLPASLGLSLSFALLPLSMSCAGTAGRTVARPRLFVIGVATLVVLSLIAVVLRPRSDAITIPSRSH